MGLKDSIQPITYLKNHTADLVRRVADEGGPVIITQNGRAKVVVLDVEMYDQWREATTLLKILAMSEASARAGRVRRQSDVFRRAKEVIRKATRRG